MENWFSCLFVAFGLLMTVYGCSVTEKWRRQSFEELMYQFDMVVVGTDIRHVDSDYLGLDRAKDSEFRVSCVLKGGNQSISENITIAGVEPENSCLPLILYPGGDFIVGITRHNGQYMLHEVHYGQPISFENTTSYLERAARLCGFQNPKLPNGYSGTPPPYCTPRKQTLLCVAGSGRDRLSVTLLFVTLVLSPFLTVF